MDRDFLSLRGGVVVLYKYYCFAVMIGLDLQGAFTALEYGTSQPNGIREEPKGLHTVICTEPNFRPCCQGDGYDDAQN